MKKRTYLIVCALICISVLSIFIQPLLQPKNSEDVVEPLTIFYHEPEDITITKGAGTLPSKLINLTIPQLVNDSDLVVVAKITSTGKYYSQYPRLPFTLYQAEILQTIKGTQKNKEITLLVYGGYVRENWFTIIESEPDCKLGSTWLLFLDEREYEPTFELKLPENTYRPRPPTSLMIIENKIKEPIESYHIYLPKINVSNTSIDDFISLYGSP